MIKLTTSEICEKLDALWHVEDVLRSGKVLNDADREQAAELISEYTNALLDIKVEI